MTWKTVLKLFTYSLKTVFMEYTIKDLQAEGLSKSLIYDVLKLSVTVSKQFLKNKRIFNTKDIEIFKYYKKYWEQKTVLEFWEREEVSYKAVEKKLSSNSFKTQETVWKNSMETVNIDIQKAVQEEIKTVKKQFEDREVEFTKTIEQKNQLIKIKDEQSQKYALLKQEEKKEKEEWIKKYEKINDEKGELLNRFYNVKMYMMIFIILFILSLGVSTFIFMMK